MKRKLRRILIPAILLPMLLTSCTRLPPGSLPGSSVSAPQSSAPPSPSASPLAEEPTAWHSGVQTDYTHLTPYEPPAEKYARLSDGPMTELVPSDTYGSLLPYVGATMYGSEGYRTIRHYGLVTKDGMIVTDPVFSDAYQGSYYDNSTYTGSTMPVYLLAKLEGEVDEDNYWASELRAVCALDGSWATDFSYRSIYCTDTVIVLVRDYETNDIDIIDYNGKLLYNTKTLGCYGELPESSAYSFMSGYGEGLILVPLKGCRSVVIDALTGSETLIDYEQCSAFSEGRAAVMKDGLYGFIDRSYNLVIPLQALWCDYFHNGKSIIQYPDQSSAVIDADGHVLLESDSYISRWDSDTYGVYNSDNSVAYYDAALNRITAPGGREITPMYDGWFFYNTTRNSMTIFRGDESHMFEGVDSVYGIRGDLAVVTSSGDNTYREGVMTLTGDVVIPMLDDQSVVLAYDEKTGETYIIASTYYEKQSYKVYDSGGRLLFDGSGYASYNAAFGLFEVSGELSYAYVDKNGEDVFRISLLEYVPD
jgi:hypothetical protein